MRSAIVISILVLGVGCAHHARYGDPAPAPTITCELAVADRVIAPGQRIQVKVTLRNAGRSKAWIVRRIDTVNADWLVDGRDQAARRDEALAAVSEQDARNGISFSGPTGEGFGLSDYIVLAPHKAKTLAVDLYVVTAESTEAAGDVDLSIGTLLGRALDAPGPHQLGLTVRSYPASEYHNDDDPPYDLEWTATCPAVELETRPR